MWLGFACGLGVQLGQATENAGKIRDDLHLDMRSNLRGSVPDSGLAVPTFVVRTLPRHIVQMISGGRVSDLAKKDGTFLKAREISRRRNFGGAEQQSVHKLRLSPTCSISAKPGKCRPPRPQAIKNAWTLGQ
jgi:hypothetical protein